MTGMLDIQIEKKPAIKLAPGAPQSCELITNTVKLSA